MATRTIKQIPRTLTGTTQIDILNSSIEGEDSTGSYQVNLGVVRDKFLEDVSGTTYDSVYDGLIIPNTVGGISGGTSISSLEGKTFSELFDDLLVPTINPTYTTPFNTFSNGGIPSLLQIGTGLTNILFTIGFDIVTHYSNRGSILINGVFQNYRSGVPIALSGYNYSYTGGGSGSLTTPTSSATQTLSSYTVVQGSQSWGGSVNYDTGPQPYDNKSVAYGSPLPAGTTTTQTVGFEGVYPLFGTTSSISNPDTQQTLVSMLTGNNIEFTMVTQPSASPAQSFDIPVAWLSGRPLVDVEQYAGAPFFSWTSLGLPKWTTSATTHLVQGNTINYTRYSWNQGSIGNRTIRLVF